MNAFTACSAGHRYECKTTLLMQPATVMNLQENNKSPMK